jgi:exopolyphosphatase / guanosine-5'-triphosphate,3'-diphosphate pyrophosphatase
VAVKSSKANSGLSGLPLFHYSAKRKLERLGVVDVGSNSVRLVVFDGAARSPAYFFNEKIMCGLGGGLAESGKLNPEGRARALVALKRFALLAKGMEAEPLYSVATAAVREASDGPDFCAEVLRDTGLALNVASGKEEARLSAQGVLLGWPEAKGLVCDIGGASMELAEVGKGKVGRAMTSALGPQRLAPFVADGTLEAEIRTRIKVLRKKFRGRPKTLFLVGGSWRAIARLDMERRNYPLKVLHEYEMTPEAALETVGWIGGQEVGDLRAVTGASGARMKLVPVAAMVLRELIVQFAPKRIAASSYGIREGLLYEQMPKDLRKRDPLIEACLYMERASARIPGFGKVLNRFLAPLYKGQGPERRRLVRAACLLHDVTWRAHPDYRAEVCFDNATRANLGGLDHRGRVFLGTALLHRYKNSASGTAFDAVIGLLSEEERRAAEVLGKAMRFGAMLTGANDAMMCRLKLHQRDAVLELVLQPHARDLFGEVVLARFEALAKAMGLTTKLSVA